MFYISANSTLLEFIYFRVSEYVLLRQFDLFFKIRNKNRFIIKQIPMLGLKALEYGP